MADKSLKEFGTELCHGRSESLQSSTLSNSNYGYRKQQKSKGSSYSNKDKRGYSSHSNKVLQPRNGVYKSQPLKQSGRGTLYDHRSSDQRYGHTSQKGGVKMENSSISANLLAENGDQQSGKKKSPPTSLNHLLNFTIAPAERRSSVGPGTLPPVSSGRRRRTRTGHSFNKEQFLQANCQFVVSAAGNYAVHSSDPDRLVDWDQIEQIRLFCHQIPSCPICLYPPRAAKITRCGHVYCWSCVLHYLSLGDKKWRKCPICYESIYKKDLKSVTALASHQYSVGDTLTLKLMARKKGKTLALPRDEWPTRGDGLLTLQDAAVNQFAKLLSATPAQVLALIAEPERRELERQLSGIDKDSASEQCFVESALSELVAREMALREAGKDEEEADTLAQRLEKASSELNEDTVLKPSLSEEEATPTWTSFADNYFESSFESPFSEDDKEQDKQEASSPSDKPSDGEGASGPVGVISPTDQGASGPVGVISPTDQDQEVEGSEHKNQLLDHTSSAPNSPMSSGSRSESSTPPHPPSDPDLTYFYQACDGQHLYIHPVNAKCLIKEYGGLECGPEEIQATIVEIERLSMSEDIRSRYRYLSHLPLTCELALVELELKPPLLSRATLTAFSQNISGRSQKRLKKKREERRRERKAEARETQPEPTFIVPTSAHELTPEVFHDFLALTSSPVSRSQSLSKKEESLANSPSSAPSFAQALQGKSPPVWPIQSPPKPRWSNSGASPKTVGTIKATEPEPSEEGAAPTFKDAFNEALASASASVVAAQNVSGGKPGSKTAKKGRKKMVLFSTGSTRGTS